MMGDDSFGMKLRQMKQRNKKNKKKE